jgi:GTP 3',8-cyclase
MTLGASGLRIATASQLQNRSITITIERENPTPEGGPIAGQISVEVREPGPPHRDVYPLASGPGRDIFETVHAVNYMRISVTDRCNERCLYCQPRGPFELLPRAEILSYEEILRVTRVAVSLGIVKYRVTGGEPLVRQGVVDFLRELCRLPGVLDVGLSTNGTRLAPIAEEVRRFGVTKVNISLDTLQPERYRAITGGRLQEVLDAVDAAVRAGFPQVKLNCVLMKKRNDDEVFDLIEFARRKDVALRFIELMPVSTTEVLTEDNFLAVETVKRWIGDRCGLEPLAGYRGNGPAEYFTIPGARTSTGAMLKLGFIGALSNLHFCEACNKLRLTPDGRLRPCLGHHEEYDLRSVLRSGGDDADLRQVFERTIARKPQQHEFRENYQPGRRMVAIGG